MMKKHPTGAAMAAARNAITIRSRIFLFSS
jgi:hypothetical protein